MTPAHSARAGSSTATPSIQPPRILDGTAMFVEQRRAVPSQFVAGIDKEQAAASSGMLGGSPTGPEGRLEGESALGTLGPLELQMLAGSSFGTGCA